MVLDVAGPPGAEVHRAALRLRGPARPVVAPDLGTMVLEVVPLEASSDGGRTWASVLGVVPAPGVHASLLAARAAQAGVEVDLLPLAGELLVRARQLARGETGPVQRSPGPCPGGSGTRAASRKASCRERSPSRSGPAW